MKIKVFLSVSVLIFFLNCKKQPAHSQKIIFEDFATSKNVILDSTDVPVHLRKIVAQISGINSYNFDDFDELKNSAAIEELLNLTNNKNKVVSLYAANALAEKKYSEIDKLFVKLINYNQNIDTENGCLVGKMNMSVPFYQKYFYSLEDKNISSDKILLKFDSIILLNKNSDDKLVRYALQNRLYPSYFKFRLQELAFKKKNKDAILYFSNWHKAEYNSQLQEEFRILLDKDSLPSFQFQTYIKELASFQNKQNNSFILEKLKKDTMWKQDETRLDMIWFLDRKGFDINDL